MPDNIIEPSAVIIGDVTFGNDNYVGHHSVLVGPLSIGSGNYISNSVTIGTLGEDDIYQPSVHNPNIPNANMIKIGNGNVFREYMTVHRGLVSETIIGNNNYFMSRSHISHDNLIGNHVKVANNVAIGGFSSIQDHSYLGLGAVLHQFSVVGSGCMVGMNSTVTKSIKPGSLVFGQPAKVIKPNIIGLAKFGINHADWWGLDSSTYPDIYLQLLQMFEDEYIRRSEQQKEIREWRSSVFQNRT